MEIRVVRSVLEANDVVALSDQPLPPGGFQIAAQLSAQGPVIPEAVDPSVNLTGRIDETPAQAERDNFLH